jgi:N-acetylgalactosamine kinase
MKRQPAKPISIILAAGRGTRMKSSTTHKVCFPIVGRPAILRALESYLDAGIEHIQIVVGAFADQVIQTVGREYPETTFVFQSQQLGTGHAARVGVMPLVNMGYRGPILVTMGDKLIQPQAVKTIINTFEETDADAIVGTIPIQRNSSGGRVVQHRDGRFAGIVETRDISKAELIDKIYKTIRSLISGHEETAATLAEEIKHVLPETLLKQSDLTDLIDGADWSTLAKVLNEQYPQGSGIKLGTAFFPLAEVQKSKHQNAALYLVRNDALVAGLQHLSTDNAQGEEYLTDCFNYLANAQNNEGKPLYKVEQVVLNPDDVLTYNNPEELLAVEDQVRRRLAIKLDSEPLRKISEDFFKPVSKWLELISRGKEVFSTTLTEIYGDNQVLWEDRLASYKKALTKFAEVYGPDRKVIIVRAPGRINIMGRHIEHRGGTVNVMAIDKEVVLVASPREDDVVRICNTDDKQYPEEQFKIGAELSGLPWDDWLDYINHEHVRNLVYESRGLWLNYVKAAFLRLQFKFRDVQLRGFDAVFTGNIPVAAGLSSSSAVVVSSAEAAATLNGLDVTPHDFVDLCGEGEWYVGSRGGAGDHAAMKFSQRGAITQIGFFPFEVRGSTPFPGDYRLVIADSHVKARKMTNAKNLFNQRVASYEFGLMLLRRFYPDYTNLMQHLRDVSPARLGVRTSEIYEMLLSLPERISVKELMQHLDSDSLSLVDRILSSHEVPDEYLIRSVVLYGIAECHRATVCQSYLAKQDMQGLGELMRISHNGDRVVSYKGNWPKWESIPYDYSVSSAYVQELIADLRSEEPRRVLDAQLIRQPGGYACSTPEIDMMVDLTIGVPGVMGAQLSGAGLGGCIMVLLHKDSIPALETQLTRAFYEPNNLEPAINVIVPVKGSGLIAIKG